MTKVKARLTRRHLALAVTLAGIGLIATGAALVYLAAGLIVGGIGLAALGLVVIPVDDAGGS